MVHDKNSRVVKTLTIHEQSEILWSFIMDFKSLSKDLAKTAGLYDQDKLQELLDLSKAVDNVCKYAADAFDTKLYNSFILLGNLINEFVLVNKIQIPTQASLAYRSIRIVAA